MEFSNLTNNEENKELTPIKEIIENPEIKTEIVNNSEPEIKEKKRGRPKKNNSQIKNENKTEIKTEKKEVSNDPDKGKTDLKKFLEDFKTEETQTTGTPTSPEIINNTNMSPVISGYMLLLICDFVFPAAIIFIISKASKNLKKKIVAKNLKLTKDEKKELEPLANEAVKYMFSEMHPLTAFFVSLSSIYVGKTVESLSD